MTEYKINICDAYIASIRSKARKEYAKEYLNWLRDFGNGCDPEPVVQQWSNIAATLRELHRKGS